MLLGRETNIHWLELYGMRYHQYIHVPVLDVTGMRAKSVVVNGMRFNMYHEYPP